MPIPGAVAGFQYATCGGSGTLYWQINSGPIVANRVGPTSQGSTPVAYGPDSAVVGNMNQWSVGTSTTGAMSIPLTVRYVRTAGAVTLGTVKGSATFTMSYQ
jgi:type 1 fimbria pilin